MRTYDTQRRLKMMVYNSKIMVYGRGHRYVSGASIVPAFPLLATPHPRLSILFAQMSKKLYDPDDTCHNKQIVNSILSTGYKAILFLFDIIIIIGFLK